MAFNFNWSPLIADTSRARDMLTTALNKSPKPPIIVDDIIVTELNLGSVPPELEILEIGDLAEDRFRGIFKMSYTGDAFLTLKTRVQANPLNTYLSTKPTFASPQPLAAASGLTIPLQITLSDIRLSGFVILVFSRQKGLTLVFRNDPLESLKVSSTFDSIPFVRDYLQKEIEGQLRVLFMEDLPAILHRLSLRLWSPEYQELDKEMAAAEAAQDKDEQPIDPLASPPLEPVNLFGEDSQISEFSLDPPTEHHASFSQKNLLRLAALTESQRTLSLFTPSIRDTVFRAWAGVAERADSSGFNTPALTLSSLSRVQSNMSSTASTHSLSNSETGSNSSRPTLYSFNSATYQGLGISAARTRQQQNRTKKRRIVNLRRDKSASDSGSVTTDATPDPSVTASESSSVAYSTIDRGEVEAELPTRPHSPLPPTANSSAKAVRFNSSRRPSLRPDLPAEGTTIHSSASLSSSDKPVSAASPPHSSSPSSLPPSSEKNIPIRPAPPRHHYHSQPPSTANPMLRSYSFEKLHQQQQQQQQQQQSQHQQPPHHQHHYHHYPTPLQPFGDSMGMSGGILEQAWINKIAKEVERRVKDEKGKGRHAADRSESQPNANANAGFWGRPLEEDGEEGVGEAPPAYVA